MAGVHFPFPSFLLFPFPLPLPFLRLHASQQFTVWYLAPNLYIQRHERKLKHSCEFPIKGAVLCSHALFHEDTIEGVIPCTFP